MEWEPEIDISPSMRRKKSEHKKSLFEEPRVQKCYGIVTPPPILNSYMNNEYFMKRRPQSRIAKIKKTEDQKTYAEKFLDYIE